ncbi:hypothetical protein TRFO_22075 [Tritrichomonas foetus]|uniref:PAS domain-containing protein n=1 Tax=Tritrichomonas foetus TaxID=1144522 RepID=A0A1J4KD85_9EUKA|nr:hypothetical protein TRFO_22075 [Tritrichomonas foetus]|eukprot:OHT09155.1 hypothetical protein TRFO_22075 [Tritrichomonas foetus]
MAVILLVLVLPVFNNALEYFDRIQTCTILSNNIALGKVSLFAEWAYQIGIYYSDELYRDTLSEESRNEESSLRPELGRGQVVLTMSTIIDNYKALIVSFSHFMAESENSSHEATIFIERNTNRNICSDQGKIELEENISLKNAIAIILLTYYNLAFTDIDYTTFGSSQFFCQIDGTLRSILDSIDHGIADTRLSLLQELDANNSLFVIMMIVYVFIDLLIIIPLFHFSLFYYYYEAKRLFNALKELDVIESRKGSNLILLNSEGGDEEIVTNHSLNNFAEKNILFALLDILFSSFTFIAILVIFITSMSFNKSTVKFVDWSISGNKRLSIVYSALGQISEALVFKDSPPSFTNFSTSLNIGKQYAAELSDLHISFYGGEGGIKGKYKDLDHLHLSDQCVAPDITQTKHDYYHCLGLDQLLNYFMISIGAIDEKFSFNSEDYINIFHISVCELADRLYQSRMLIRVHMRAGISNQIIINVMMIMLCLVGIVALSITTFLNIQRFKTMIKAGLILIRRIPPPAIAGCESLKTFLSGPKQNSKEIKSASQIIFETLPTAVLDVASDETIEMMNEKAKLLFGFKEGQIIGQKLDCIIGKIENSEQNEEITEEAAGSIKLYSYFKEAGQITNTEDINGSNVKSSASFIVNCRCADDSILRCEAKLYPVSVYTGTNSNFIVYLHETSNDSEVQAKIKEAKDDVHRLLNQLVPSDVQGFIRGDRKDFSFVSKSATAIVIQTYGFFDNIKKFGHEVYLSKIFKLFQHFELGCLQFPPVMKYRQFSDMFIAIGGLFNKNDEPSMHTKAAISYAKQMISDIVDQHVHLDNNYENTNFDGHSDYNKSWGCDFAIQIGIATGGPLICGLNGIQNTSFDVAGSIIDDAILFAENSNVGRILLNEQAKDLSGELCEQGSMIERKLASFYLPDSIDAKSVLATQSSYRSNKKLSSKPITESMKTIAKLFKEVDAIPEDDGDLEEENNELSREMSHPIFDDETIE